MDGVKPFFGLGGGTLRAQGVPAGAVEDRAGRRVTRLAAVAFHGSHNGHWAYRTDDKMGPTK